MQSRNENTTELESNPRRTSARTSRLIHLIAVLAAAIAASTGSVHAQKTTIAVQVSAPGKPISPDLFGIFFEDLNYAADGGLYAELIQNRSFEYNPTEQSSWNPFSFWELQKRGSDADGSMSVSAMRPVHENNPHYAMLTVRAPGEGVGIANSGFGGIPLTADETYTASFWAYQAYMGIMWGRSDNNKPMPVTLRLETTDGEVLAEEKLEIKGREWRQVAANFKPMRTVNDARLVLLADALLTGESAEAFNEDGKEPAVKPVSEKVTLNANFDYAAPANSLTVFRFRP